MQNFKVVTTQDVKHETEGQEKSLCIFRFLHDNYRLISDFNCDNLEEPHKSDFWSLLFRGIIEDLFNFLITVCFVVSL